VHGDREELRELGTKHTFTSEVEGYPGISALTGGRAERGTVALPLRLATELGELSFITTIATFGTPLDITVAELAIESFFPANDATARAVRAAARS
jgi:hypothetical protein